MVNLFFQRISENPPQHGDCGYLIVEGEFRFVRFSYSWEETDEDGDFTGLSFDYVEGGEVPPNCVRTLYDDTGDEVPKRILWISEEDFNEAMNKD